MHDVPDRKGSGMTPMTPVRTATTGSPVDLRGRSFLKELDFTAAEFLSLVDLGASLKAEKLAGRERPRLAGRTSL